MTQTDFPHDGNLPKGTVAVVVVGAGSGERLGEDVPKAFVELGGKTLLERAAETAAFSGAGNPGAPQNHHATFLVVVAPSEYLGEASKTVSKIVSDIETTAGQGTNGSPDVRFFAGAKVVAGGKDRQSSVKNGLAEIPDSVDYVLIHDAARPLADQGMFASVIEALWAGAKAVVPAVDVVDTMTQVRTRGTRVYVDGYVDRSSLRAVQTPQGFDLPGLRKWLALHQSALTTDESAVAQLAGVPVEVIPGLPEAFKITTPGDLEHARLMVNAGGRSS